MSEYLRPMRVAFNGTVAFFVDANGRTVPWEVIQELVNETSITRPEATSASGIVVSPALLDVLVCVVQGQRRDRALSATALHYLEEAERLLTPSPLGARKEP